MGSKTLPIKKGMLGVIFTKQNNIFFFLNNYSTQGQTKLKALELPSYLFSYEVHFTTAANYFDIKTTSKLKC